MVLDDLGDSLKGTLKKIANAAHVDSKLVKMVVRDRCSAGIGLSVYCLVSSLCIASRVCFASGDLWWLF